MHTSQTNDNPRKDIYNSDMSNANSPTTDVSNYGVYKPRDGIPKLHTCSNTDKNNPPLLDECAMHQTRCYGQSGSCRRMMQQSISVVSVRPKQYTVSKIGKRGVAALNTRAISDIK
ncbi:hypothetical protein T265_07869 [Opisthorchis viverrini]|uniref:Uncharacterized protein n=1 Tax=Opisthorchis viverrini TaxID=6198 RepID=A0A075AA47_OPIVI|nr:hypothetical protein T265_07869 [Opisthorchis viverrini]KER24439.1 hypothetical protein T265_07869 [Opisthorchis viverrini]